MNQDLLSILIVNYNGENFLNNCINSIQENCQGIAFEILVVDNNSSDKSIDLLKKNFPEVKIIENNENLGFAKGNNIGVNRSIGNYILLLNNDTILLDPVLPAIEFFRKDPSVGIVGIKMLDEQNRFVASFGKFPRFYNFLKLSTLQINIKDMEVKKNPISLDWISGAFLLTTRPIWQQVNGLDASYFMYVEDMDFNKKVSELKKKSVFLPTLRFIHFGGFNKTREKQLISSYQIYVRKHKKGIDMWLSLMMLNLNLHIKKALKRILTRDDVKCDLRV
jgi:GT2 family glycosyltransferase